MPHPELHAVFETLGYGLGFAVFKRQARSGDVINGAQRWNVIAAATIGALVGSRLLGIAEQMMVQPVALASILFPSGGKTIIGGLLGGWLGVELVKKLSGVTVRTGDVFAVPLCLGIAVGRIGCFLAGLGDSTYGRATSLPWAVDFGDGVPRHPTQAYEILFVLALAFCLSRVQRRPHATGRVFRVFLGSYLVWRFVIDFLKPEPSIAGLNLLQWACAVGLAILMLNRRMPSETRGPQIGAYESA